MQRRLRQRRPKGRQQPVARLDQDDARRRGIDVAEIRRQRLAGQLGDGAGHLDAGRSAADDDEIQQPPALLSVGLGLGLLERDEDACGG